jgi:predicted SAM-dependent methyltransferase
MKRAINLGCGDQHFDSTPEIEWLNMDLDARDGKVEIAGDVSKELPFPAETFDLIVASHIVEHIEMSIVKDVIADWMRCLKKDGHLIITVPNARALAERYVTQDISHFIFSINMTGPYHGKETDHHAWTYDYAELADRVSDNFLFRELKEEDLETLNLKGKVAMDWWIIGIVIMHKN